MSHVSSDASSMQSSSKLAKLDRFLTEDFKQDFWTPMILMIQQQSKNHQNSLSYKDKKTSTT
jgi:hypothetical protein